MGIWYSSVAAFERMHTTSARCTDGERHEQSLHGVCIAWEGNICPNRRHDCSLGVSCCALQLAVDATALG